MYKPRIFLFAPVNDFSKHFCSTPCFAHLPFDVNLYFTSVNVWNASSVYPHVQDPSQEFAPCNHLIFLFEIQSKEVSYDNYILILG